MEFILTIITPINTDGDVYPFKRVQAAIKYADEVAEEWDVELEWELTGDNTLTAAFDDISFIIRAK